MNVETFAGVTGDALGSGVLVWKTADSDLPSSLFLNLLSGE